MCVVLLWLVTLVANAEEVNAAGSENVESNEKVLVESSVDSSIESSANSTEVPESGPVANDEDIVDPCDQFDAEYDSWLDRNQVRVYRTVCQTAAWVDGFFGDSRYDRETGNTFGRVSVGNFYDQRDGWDSDFRLRARYPFPALRNKATILVGSGDEQELIEERTTSGQENLPSTAGRNSSDSLYIGFGFQGFDKGNSGLDYGVGLKVRSSPELVAKTTYRKSWRTSERSEIRARPIAYWRSEEGFGSTLHLDYDYLISDAMLFRWGNFGNVSEDEEVDGMDWGSSFSLFQVLSKRRALTYRVFVNGETEAEVKLKNYGFELRYRQRILREWLFIEYLGRISWPREFIIEDRDTNLGAGIRLEAFFGPTPEGWVR